MTISAAPRTRAEANSLCGRRHERRRLGSGPRLLHDDWRRAEAVKHLDPIFATLAPGWATFRTPGRKSGGTAEQGYLHCGPNGAGHFVKMVHNGIEYGVMAAYAEGWACCVTPTSASNTEIRRRTTPLRNPEHYRYDFNLRDIAEVWRRGSVIASWLLDLTAAALVEDPNFRNSPDGFPILVKGAGRLKPPSTRRCRSRSDGRLYERFSSRGEADFPTNCSWLCAMNSADTSKNPPNEEEAMNDSPLGRLGIFGATGDLAYKKFFRRCTRW